MNPSSERASSILYREQRPQGVVYVKRYAEGDWGRTREVVKTRTEREIRLLGILAESGRFGGSLGVVELLEADAERALLVTREVNGETLQVPLTTRFRRHAGRECLRALYLAGKWLRRFQSLPTCAEDEGPIGSHDPRDVVEYCALRMEKLRECGHPWASRGNSGRLLDALRRLVREVAEDERRLVWTHGDYAPGNIIWDGKVLTPLDFGMAQTNWPLIDVTYFLHRLDMMRIHRPWLRWPLSSWRRAFLRGYGRPDGDSSTAFRVLMVRHQLCRLLHYTRRPPRDLTQAAHDKWVRWCVRRALQQAIER